MSHQTRILEPGRSQLMVADNEGTTSDARNPRPDQEHQMSTPDTQIATRRGTARAMHHSTVRCLRGALVAVTVAASGLCLAQVSALALPPGRAYEQVSPVYKGGYGVARIEAVAPNGESAAFFSLGKFAGSDSPELFNDYLSHRDPVSGWSTVSLQPPSTIAPVAEVVDFSSTLDSTLAYGAAAPSGGVSASDETHSSEYLLHRNSAPDTRENWEVAGGISLEEMNGKLQFLHQDGASSDLCHIVVEESEPPGLKTVPVPGEASGTGFQKYELVRGCHGEAPALRLIALDNRGKPITPGCMSLGGQRSEGKKSEFNAISADGSEIFFETRIGSNSGCSQSLFVRLNGQRTLELSRPLDTSKPFGGCVGEGGGVPGEVPCQGAAGRAPAEFQGASEDGSKVFFTTTAQLVAEDQDVSNDLYMATIGCPPGEAACGPGTRQVTGLRLVSMHEGSQPARVQGIVRVAPDGSRVYFVATGQLLSAIELQRLAGEGRPVPVAGAENMYVYDSDTAKLGFVADLCSGPGESGSLLSPRCPSDLESAGSRNDKPLWLSGSPEAQSTGDGRFLVFSTYAQLIGEGPLADTDNALDVYRYDAQTEQLERVSVGEGGHDGNGNRYDEEAQAERGKGNADATVAFAHMSGEGARDYAQHEMGTRALSEDGSRIVFKTVEPLSAGATNGLANVYEWHDGSVSLVSGGSASEPVEEVTITPSGGDVFFTTVQSLVGQDTDVAADVYDAHMCTANAQCSAPPPIERERCEGDACQGPLTNPAPLLVPGSVAQAPGEQLGGSVKASPAAKKAKKASPKHKHGKVRGKGGRRARRSARSGGRGSR
jgi:hypothetical protein